MYKTDNEIWEAVKLLEGETLLTYVKKEKNTILQVNNTDSNTDQVIILERETYPIKKDIVAAYSLLTISGKLQRIPDLEWLTQPDKFVSSIVFRIIGEISKNHTQIDRSKKNPIIILKK